jgi:hypothetical protein
MKSHKVGRNEACPCGSGRKFKKCCLNKESTPATAPLSTQAAISQKPWGVPGEEHQLWVIPLKKGEQLPKNLIGTPGKYKIQLLLSRPGFPLTAEREHKFIQDVIGDSHIVIAKPQKERKPEDADHIILQATGGGKRVNFTGLTNENGYLGKLVVEEFVANTFHEAEAQVYEALAPFLSAWSLHLDIPVHIETIQVTNLETHIDSLRVRTPLFEMAFAGGVSPMLTDDFCQYASLYREGMNTNSSFYRFLCFYKIIESISLRRNRTNEAARLAGKEVRRFHEVVPSTSDELLTLLKDVYPWRTQWDSFALNQIIPAEVMGKKVGWVRDQRLNPLRVGIAHALLETGEVRITLDNLEHIQKVNQWLPLCRVLARLMLRNEFPNEFAMAMNPIFVRQGPS